MIGWLFKRFCTLAWSIRGWKIDPNLPEGIDRCVMLGAPHTSNWDMIYTIAAFVYLKIPYRFTIKKEWMRFPFNLLIIPLGGIGIDRSPKKEGEKRKSMVEAMVELFEQNNKLALVVTPEGTRSKRTEWKTGFYWVAHNSKVPIALSYLDYKERIGGIGKLIHTSGDMEADLKEIMAFYKHKNAKHPKNFSVDQRFE